MSEDSSSHLRAPESMAIQSHRGIYQVSFAEKLNDAFSKRDDLKDLSRCRFIIDEQVSELYRSQLAPFVPEEQMMVIEATEANKSLEKMPEHVARFLQLGAKREHRLVAIGGGIIQDISCFIASTLFRGLRWTFFPTTLLAQADSCIGSKSSINVGDWKNIVGTFTPPDAVVICSQFLETLTHFELRSGIGEMLKVHMIDGPSSYFAIAKDVERLLKDRGLLAEYTRRSLLIKKRFIELDEFDQGPRNILNYGHSFGHAIESATEFEVPHGIAVTMGMDMANYVAFRLGRWTENQFSEARVALKSNAERYYKHAVPIEKFISAIGKDKKNVSSGLTLILPQASGPIEKVIVPNDERFQTMVLDYFSQARWQ